MAFLPSSSMETPRMVKPRGLYFFWNSIIQGISTLQGSHQVAQKFTRTTCPLYCARVTSLSLRSFKATVGASVGLRGRARSRRSGRREFVIGPDHDREQRHHTRRDKDALFHVANSLTTKTCLENPVYPTATSTGSKKSVRPQTTAARRSELPPCAGAAGIFDRNAETG